MAKYGQVIFVLPPEPSLIAGQSLERHLTLPTYILTPQEIGAMAHGLAGLYGHPIKVRYVYEDTKEEMVG